MMTEPDLVTIGDGACINAAFVGTCSVALGDLWMPRRSIAVRHATGLDRLLRFDSRPFVSLPHKYKGEFRLEHGYYWTQHNNALLVPAHGWWCPG